MTEQRLRIRRCVIGSIVGLGLFVCGVFIFRPLEESRQSARNSQCRFNLKWIGLALHQYHDDWGSFPPAYVADEQGRPSYGWRTLILPYLDQAGLYHSYHFDEPWDGPHNSELRKPLSGVMPFSCPDDPHFCDNTTYLAVVGPKTAWPGTRPAKRDIDFPDGLSRTILVVEVQHSGIQWLEPQDLAFDEMSFQINDSAAKSMSSHHRVSGFWPWSGPVATVNVLFVDGTVARLQENTAPETIRAWLTAKGGEEVSSPP